MGYILYAGASFDDYKGTNKGIYVWTGTAGSGFNGRVFDRLERVLEERRDKGYLSGFEKEL